MRKNRRFPISMWLGLFCAIPPFAAGADVKSTVDDEKPIVLPQMVVVDSRFDAFPWLYAKAPGIEVLSKLSEADTVAYAEGFWKSEQMLANAVPETLWGRSKKPIILVICSGTSTTANAEGTQQIDLDRMRELEEASSAPVDAFSGAQKWLRQGANPNLAQQLVSYYDREATVFFNRRVNPSQSTVYFAAGNQGADVLLGRSLYRTLAERRAPPLPPWLEEGLPAVLAQSHLQVKQDKWMFDPLIAWPDEKGGYAVRRNVTRPPRWLSLEQLFAAEPPPRDSPDFSLWSYESALFVRWAFGKGALWNFVAGIARHGAASEELFRQCFGIGYWAASDRMHEQFKVLLAPMTLEVKVKVPTPPFQFSRASDLEIRRIIAELGRLQSEYLRPRYPKIADDYLNSALTTLAKHKGGAEKDPEFMAVWGLCALQAGDKEKARRHLEAMGTNSGVDRPLAYLALARLRYEEALQKSPAGDGRLANAHVDAVLDPLLKAIAMPPPLPEAFRLLLDLSEHGAVSFDGNSRAALQAATKLFPADQDLTQQIAKALSQPAREEPAGRR